MRELDDRPDELPEGFKIRLHWPDTEDEESEGTDGGAEGDAPESPSEQIERLINLEFGGRDGLRWHEPGRPPWSGNHFDLILFFLFSSAASGLAWDAMKWLAIGLRRVVTRSNELDFGLELESGALRYVAFAEAKRKAPKLRTVDELIRVLDVDGEGEDGTAWMGGAGVFVVVVPDLNAATTHLVVLTATGAVLEHLVGKWLSRSAEQVKQSDDTWGWSEEDTWDW